MAYTAAQILAPQVIMRQISRLALPGTSLSQLMGWNVGAGPTNGAILPVGNQTEGGENVPAGNTEDHPLRVGSYDIFDNTRKVATGSVPGTASTTIAPQKVGVVQFTIPRTAEDILLGMERLNNQRAMGQPASVVDRGGQAYIAAQTRYMSARIANLIEFQTAALFRGKYYYSYEGDILHNSFTAGDEIVDYRQPAGNRDQLKMGQATDAIDATWATSTTHIPKAIMEVNKRSVDQTGLGIRHLVCGSKVYNNIVDNDFVRQQAGSVNMPMAIGQESGGEFTVVLKALPWLVIHVVDYVLETWNPTNQVYESELVIPENIAVFMPEVDNSWVHYMRGGETVTEGPNGVTDFRMGFYPYAYPDHNPAGWRLHTVHNGFPALPVPKTICYGTVVF